MQQRKQTEQPGSGTNKRGVKQAPVRSVKRSQINLAAYNPRNISEYARKQLEKSLSKFGLVETLVWNEQTGNLVSGHQRLSVMDAKRGYPGQDYGIEVSVVYLDLKREKQLNVWLNNRGAQGTFDHDLTLDLLRDGISLEDIGFTRADLELEIGAVDLEAFLPKKDNDAASSTVAEIRAIKDRKKQVREQDAVDPEDDADYYLMIVFDSRDQKERFLREHSFPPDSRFISHAELAACKVA